MSKNVKRVIIAVVVLAVVVGGVWGGMNLLKDAQRENVKVFPVESIAMTNYWGDVSETSGMVTTDGIQKVYLSGTQTVSEVFVTEGQEVKAGDPLVAYDTTLSNLDVTRAEIALEKSKSQLETANRELRNLKNATSREYLESKYNSVMELLTQELANTPSANPTLPVIPMGTWTQEDPYYMPTPAGGLDLEAILEESGLEDIYIVLVDVEGGQYAAFHGLHLAWVAEEPEEGEEPAAPQEPQEKRLTLSLFDAEPLAEIPGEDTEEITQLRRELANIESLMANSYSRSEIARMQSEKQQEINDLDLQIKISENELKQKQRELDDGVVRSDIDGVVKAVRDQESVQWTGEALIEVSAGGGYYITGTLSELELDTISIGQEVTVNSWSTGETITGEIREISSDPAPNATGWTQGNQNVSWYPFTVFVGEDAALIDGDYVSISYQSGGNPNAWYLDKMFVRTDNGRSYVYVKGEDGTLEQRWIRTGRDLWGSSVEVLGGLTLEDRIAFPYGRDVVDGAETQDAELDELYNY